MPKTWISEMSLCSRSTLVVPLALCMLLPLVWAGAGAGAQDADDPPAPPAASRRIGESVSLDTDIAVTKKLKTAEDYLAAEQWEPAIEVLDGVIHGDAGTLVAVSVGRYVDAAGYGHHLLSRLPADGLAAYRRKADPQARQWLEEGQKTRDESLLRRILQRAYASSHGDEALLLLGEWAWQRGELDLARRYWKQLLPQSSGTPFAALRYPDPGVGSGDVLARLMLCSLAEANFARAEIERAALAREFPDATGKLAGKTGRLADLAGDLVEEAKSWTLPAQDSGAATFAVNYRRNGILPEPVDVGAEQWSVRFSDHERRRFTFPSHQPAFENQPPLSAHPVVHGDLVLLNDSDRIYAYDLHTGKPAWPGPAAAVPVAEGAGASAVIYQLHDDLFQIAPRAAVGVPRFSMTVHDGRLYARMGTPVTSRNEHDKRPFSESSLVVLDLDPQSGQGKLLAKISADRFGAPWSFEGSPVVAGNRIYIALRRSQPQMQFNVACFDGETGRLIWNRKVCAAVSNIGRVHNLISHQLLTLAEETLFLSTDVGAVAALDAHDGAPLWVLTYDSNPSESPAVLSDHTRQGVLPCLYHQETVFAAPNDSDQLFAIDAHSGTVKWRRRLNDRIRHLLGVGQGKLIVSGNSLWGLDAETGEIAWGRENADPEYYGYGRGLLVDDAVWWPTREAIEIRSQRSGRRVHRQPILLAAHGTTAARNTGGNLLIAGNYLLVAQTDRLVAYGEHSLPIEATEGEISALKVRRP